jgi:hypothetical protein
VVAAAVAATVLALLTSTGPAGASWEALVVLSKTKARLVLLLPW